MLASSSASWPSKVLLAGASLPWSERTGTRANPAIERQVLHEVQLDAVNPCRLIGRQVAALADAFDRGLNALLGAVSSGAVSRAARLTIEMMLTKPSGRRRWARSNDPPGPRFGVLRSRQPDRAARARVQLWGRMARRIGVSPQVRPFVEHVDQPASNVRGSVASSSARCNGLAAAHRPHPVPSTSCVPSVYRERLGARMKARRKLARRVLAVVVSVVAITPVGPAHATRASPVSVSSAGEDLRGSSVEAAAAAVTSRPDGLQSAGTVMAPSRGAVSRDPVRGFRVPHRNVVGNELGSAAGEAPGVFRTHSSYDLFFRDSLVTCR